MKVQENNIKLKFAEEYDIEAALAEFDVHGVPLTIDHLEKYDVVEGLMMALVARSHQHLNSGTSIAVTHSPKKMYPKTVNNNVLLLEYLLKRLELHGKYKEIDHITRALFLCGDYFREEYHSAIGMYLDIALQVNSNFKGLGCFDWKFITGDLAMTLIIASASRIAIMLCTSVLTSVLLVPVLMLTQLACAFYISHLLVNALFAYCLAKNYSVELSENKLKCKLDSEEFLGLSYVRLFNVPHAMGRVSVSYTRDVDVKSIRGNLLYSYRYVSLKGGVLNRGAIIAALELENDGLYKNGMQIDNVAKVRATTLNHLNFHVLLSSLNNGEVKKCIELIRERALIGAVELKLSELFVLDELYRVSATPNYRSILDTRVIAPSLKTPKVIENIKNDALKAGLSGAYKGVHSAYYASKSYINDKYQVFKMRGVVSSSIEDCIKVICGKSLNTSLSDMIKELAQEKVDIGDVEYDLKLRKRGEKINTHDVSQSWGFKDAFSTFKVEDPRALKNMEFVGNTIMSCIGGVLLYSYICSPMIFPVAIWVLGCKVFNVLWVIGGYEEGVCNSVVGA